MNIRFKNARILPFRTEEATIIEGELWTSGDRIAWIGDPKGREPLAFDREIDCKGNLILQTTSRCSSGCMRIASRWRRT